MDIYEFQKNALEKIKIQSVEFKGKKRIDIRVFFNESNDCNTNWIPTKKGLSLEFELLSALKVGIDKALDFIRSEKSIQNSDEFDSERRSSE